MRWSHKCERHPSHFGIVITCDARWRSLGSWFSHCPHCEKPNPYHKPKSAESTQADRDIAVMRASIIAYKEARNGIERHPGNTAHENAAWEWGRKDGGWS